MYGLGGASPQSSPQPSTCERKMGRMRILKLAGLTLAALLVVLSGLVFVATLGTERDVERFRDRVAELGANVAAPAYDPSLVATLPEPVQRYFAFAFRGPLPDHTIVRLEAEGDFRRPLSDDFGSATAQQVIAIGTPALMFSATTDVLPGIWARAYDYFAEGEMEMKAKILSSLTVVDFEETPELNRISLRRWLLESALYPQALLPGGPVSWEAVDADSARAVAQADGLRASMIAHFDAEGRMTQMRAEDDGDLATPYHGSGEHVRRADYQAVGNQMIPMEFTISRAAGGELYPFWRGRITSITFQ